MKHVDMKQTLLANGYELLDDGDTEGEIYEKDVAPRFVIQFNHWNLWSVTVTYGTTLFSNFLRSDWELDAVEKQARSFAEWVDNYDG